MRIENEERGGTHQARYDQYTQYEDLGKSHLVLMKGGTAAFNRLFSPSTQKTRNWLFVRQSSQLHSATVFLELVLFHASEARFILWVIGLPRILTPIFLSRKKAKVAVFRFRLLLRTNWRYEPRRSVLRQ